MTQIHPVIKFLHNKRLEHNIGTKKLGWFIKQSVGEWENGACTPRISSVTRWAAAFGYELALRRLKCCNPEGNHPKPGRCLCPCHPPVE